MGHLLLLTLRSQPLGPARPGAAIYEDVANLMPIMFYS